MGFTIGGIVLHTDEAMHEIDYYIARGIFPCFVHDFSLSLWGVDSVKPFGAAIRQVQAR